jgi:hypothetical protein
MTAIQHIEHDPEAEVARHQVQLAIVIVANRHRLLGSLLNCMQVQVTPGAAAVSTHMQRGRLTLVVNPTWAENAPMDDLEGAIIHEVNHLLLGHHEIDGIGLDASLLDIAKDLGANEFNDRSAPRGTATLADFPGFPPGEPVLARYDRLRVILASAGEGPTRRSGGDAGEAKSGVNDEEPRHAGDLGEPVDDEVGDADDDDADGDDEENENQTNPASEPQAPVEAGVAVDGDEDADDAAGESAGEHADQDVDAGGNPTPVAATTPGVGSGPTAEQQMDGPGGPSGTQADAGSAAPASESTSGSSGSPPPEGSEPGLEEHSLVIQAIIAAAARNVSPESLSRQERSLLIQIPEIQVGCGSGTSAHASLLPPSRSPGGLVPWKRTLRRFVGQALPTAHPSYMRPPRRLPALLGIIPGRQSSLGKPVILAAIDTSGSMSDAVLSDIAAELRVLARGRRVIVVQCDCAVHSVERFSGCIERCVGRGGTDFRPIFEPGLLRRTKADLVIVFTDGDGPAPDKPPRIPVLWTITTTHRAPAAWGEIIRMTHYTATRPHPDPRGARP